MLKFELNNPMRIKYDSKVYYAGTVANVNGTRKFLSLRYGFRAAHKLLNDSAKYLADSQNVFSFNVNVGAVLNYYQSDVLNNIDSDVYEVVLGRAASIYAFLNHISDVGLYDLKVCLELRTFLSCSVPLTLALCEFMSQVTFSKDELIQYRNYLRL